MTSHPTFPRASTMRYYDSFLTHHDSGPHRIAEQAEFGPDALTEFGYENEGYYLVEVPLHKVLRRRYSQGIRRNGMSSAPVDNGTTGPEKTEYVQVGGVPPLQESPAGPAEDDYAQQDREYAALRDIGSPVWASYEIGNEWDNYAEVEG